jgi:hypothetical protein
MCACVYWCLCVRERERKKYVRACMRGFVCMRACVPVCVALLECNLNKHMGVQQLNICILAFAQIVQLDMHMFKGSTLAHVYDCICGRGRLYINATNVRVQNCIVPLTMTNMNIHIHAGHNDMVLSRMICMG